MKQRLAELSRFLMTGGLNTLLTVAFYQALVTWLSPELSYALSWLAGFVFIAFAYPLYVFRNNRVTAKKTSLLALVYIASFSLGLLLMHELTGWGVHPRLSVFVVIGITTVVNYTLAKLLFSDQD